MTAIIGYISRKGQDSIGVLCADDLEGISKVKVDKLSKLSNRFVFGVTGLEAVDWAIGYAIGHLDKFSGSRANIESVSDLESLLNDIIPNTFSRWKKANLFGVFEKQKDTESMLIVLDLLDNSLYYADLGKVWMIDEEKDYKIRFEKLDDGLYTFGIVAVSENYDKEEYSVLNLQEVQKYLESKMRQYKLRNPQYVGDLGSKQINLLGEKQFESFYSCYNSPMDIIDNMIRRTSLSKPLLPPIL